MNFPLVHPARPCSYIVDFIELKYSGEAKIRPYFTRYWYPLNFKAWFHFCLLALGVQTLDYLRYFVYQSIVRFDFTFHFVQWKMSLRISNQVVCLGSVWLVEDYSLWKPCANKHSHLFVTLYFLALWKILYRSHCSTLHRQRWTDHQFLNLIQVDQTHNYLAFLNRLWNRNNFFMIPIVWLKDQTPTRLDRAWLPFYWEKEIWKEVWSHVTVPDRNSQGNATMKRSFK